MSKKFLIGMAVLLSASLFFLGCGGGDEDEPETPANADDPVKGEALVLTALVTTPATDAEDASAIAETAPYTGEVAWTPPLADGKFAASTDYKAVVTLAAKDGYTFDGSGANAFVHAGAKSVTNPASSGKEVTVTIVFPITLKDAAGTRNDVTAVDLAALVPVPKTGDEAKLTFDAGQYTGQIAWDKDLAEGKFAPIESYTATVTLAAAPEYTFEGFAGTFVHAGADSVVPSGFSAAGGTVAIQFPATGGTPEVPGPVNALNLTGAIAAPETGAESSGVFAALTDQYTGGTVAWTDSADAPVLPPAKFAGSAVYKAAVTLAPATGYTFDDPSVVFTHAGATSAVKSAVAADGKVTVTVTFIETRPVVTALNLAGALVVPVTGVKPDTAFTAPDVTQYTGGDAVWTPEIPEDGTFLADTAYTAEVTLKTAGDYTFATLGAAAFSSVAGAVTAFDAETGVVKVTFAKTAATVDALALAGVLDKPSKNQKPQLTLNGDQYTGTVAWKNIDGSNFTGTAFAAATPYKAVVTLTAKQPSFTFYGFTADFGYSGAAKVDPTAVADVNTATVAIEFGNTEASETTVALEFNPIRVTSSTGSLEGIVLTKGGTAPTTVTLTVSSVTSEFPITSPKWYVDGNPTAVTATNQGFTLVLSSAAAYSTVRDNAHSVTVTGNAASKPYSFEVPFTVKAAAN